MANFFSKKKINVIKTGSLFSVCLGEKSMGKNYQSKRNVQFCEIFPILKSIFFYQNLIALLILLKYLLICLFEEKIVNINREYKITSVKSI